MNSLSFIPQSEKADVKIRKMDDGRQLEIRSERKEELCLMNSYTN
jgi:hypothetical protein